MFITACIILILTIIEMLSLYAVKIFSLTNLFIYYLASVGGYGSIMYGLSYLVMSSKIGIINHFWNVLSTVGGLSMGYLAFGETLTMYETIGIIMSTTGIFIMGTGDKLIV